MSKSLDEIEKLFEAEALSYHIFAAGNDVTDLMTKEERVSKYACWLARCPDVEHLDFVKDDE